MSIFFDEDKSLVAPSNESWSSGAKTDFWENASAAFKAFRRTEVSTSELNNREEEIGNAIQILHDAGHTNILNPLDSNNYFVDDMETAPDRSVMEADFWTKVEKLTQDDQELKFKLMEAGLDNQENMHQTIAKKAHSSWEEYSEINERATGFGKIGGFGGIAGGAFTDPWMQLATVASFGYSVPATFSAAALKVALMEAIIGGVAETMIQLKAQPYRKELGFEDAGLETGIKNVAMVSLAAGTLSPALMGVFKLFGKGIDVGKKHLLKLSTEDLQKINKELGEINPKFKNKTLEEAQLPPKDNPFPDNAAGRTEHRERLDAAVKSVNESTNLNLPPIKSKIDPVSTKPEKIKLNEITKNIPLIKKTVKDVENVKKNLSKITDANPTIDKINEVQTTSGFNKKETDLLNDINYVKEFDNPTDVVLKKQTDQLKDEFSKDLEKEFPTGVKIDEKSGEKTVIFKTGKQILDEELQDIKMLNHIKKCAKL